MILQRSITAVTTPNKKGIYNETNCSDSKHSVSRDYYCCILVQDYSYCRLQAWVISNITVIDHCGHNSNNKTLTTIKQSIQTASIVSVETIIAVF